MSTTTTRPAFTDTELSAEEIDNPFRPSGLVSFFVGIISSSALASTSLLVIPLCGILVGLFTLRPAKDPKTQPGGRVFAVLGIALSVFFAGWSWSYYNVHNKFLVSNGTEFALDWLQVLRDGNIEFAYELTQPARTRQSDTMPLSQYYIPKNEMAYEQFQTFKTSTVVQGITTASKDPEWRLKKVLQSYNKYDEDHIVLVFADSSGALGPVLLDLCCAPARDKAGRHDTTKPWQWHVAEFTPADIKTP